MQIRVQSNWCRIRLSLKTNWFRTTNRIGSDQNPRIRGSGSKDAFFLYYKSFIYALVGFNLICFLRLLLYLVRESKD